jgi:uncharacterized protein YjbI with pentapeptide repeats
LWPLSHARFCTSSFTGTRFRRYHEVGNAVFLQLGVIFAVLLALAFNNFWSDYDFGNAGDGANFFKAALDGANLAGAFLTGAQYLQRIICIGSRNRSDEGRV